MCRYLNISLRSKTEEFWQHGSNDTKKLHICKYSIMHIFQTDNAAVFGQADNNFLVTYSWAKILIHSFCRAALLLRRGRFVVLKDLVFSLNIFWFQLVTMCYFFVLHHCKWNIFEFLTVGGQTSILKTSPLALGTYNGIFFTLYGLNNWSFNWKGNPEIIWYNKN